MYPKFWAKAHDDAVIAAHRRNVFLVISFILCFDVIGINKFKLFLMVLNPVPMLRKLFATTLITFLSLSHSVCAQDFTLAAEYAKQVKKYPDIKPYDPDVKNVSAQIGVTFSHPEGGRDLKLDYFLPSNLGKSASLTPVVFIHGGGWLSGSRNLDWPMAQRLASEGFATFCVDYRLSTEAIFPAAVVDINSALAWIGSKADSLNLDMSKLTVIGASAGGQLASLVGASNGQEPLFLPEASGADSQPKVACVVDIDGVLAFIHPDSDEGHDKPGKVSCATRWLGKPVAQDSALWANASAISHIGEWSARRFLFINSAQKRFSAGQSEVVAHLKSLNKTAAEFKTESTPHTFWLFDPWAENVTNLIISFLRKN